MTELQVEYNLDWKGVLLENLNTGELLSSLKSALELSEEWETSIESEGVVIQNGFLPYSPIRAYRSTVEIAAGPEQVAEMIADKAVEYLPLWNREFRDGQVQQIIENSQNRKSWVHRVRYRTPVMLRDREYLYYMVRENLKDGTIIIGYMSIDDADLKPERGTVRGLLYPTVHLCEPRDGNITVLKHILANNLRGVFSPYIQNTLLSGALAEANLRDSLHQRQLFRD